MITDETTGDDGLDEATSMDGLLAVRRSDDQTGVDRIEFFCCCR